MRCSWDILKRVEGHKVVSFAPFWLALIPMVGFLEKMKPLQDNGTASHATFPGTLALPSNLFIISAFCVLVAKLVYMLHVPSIIYSYNTHKEFHDSGRTDTFYLNELLKASGMALREFCDTCVKSYSDNVRRIILGSIPSVEGADEASLAQIKTQALAQLKKIPIQHTNYAFWVLRDHYSSRRDPWLYVCIVGYCLAFAMALLGYSLEVAHLLRGG